MDRAEAALVNSKIGRFSNFASDRVLVTWWVFKFFFSILSSFFSFFSSFFSFFGAFSSTGASTFCLCKGYFLGDTYSLISLRVFGRSLFSIKGFNFS